MTGMINWQQNRILVSDLVLQTIYQTGKIALEKGIPDVTDFVKKAKLTELEKKFQILVI